MNDQFKPGWIPNVSNNDHHRGIYKDCIGSSGLKKFADYSAAHYREEIENPKDPTPAMVVGSAFHSIALGFPDEVAVKPNINRRTNEGKAEYAKFLAESEGKYVVSRPEYENILNMTKALNRHPIARKLMGFTEREVTGIWHDVDNQLWCKIRPDLISHEERIIVDLKKTRDASRKQFNRDIFKYGYHVSAAWYRYGAEQITSHGYAFIIVAVEEAPPHGINCFNVKGLAIKKAWEKIGECLGDIADCIKYDKWPNYEPRLWEPDVPGWIL